MKMDHNGDRLLKAIAEYVRDYADGYGVDFDEQTLYSAAEAVMDYMQEYVVPDVVEEFIEAFNIRTIDDDVEDEEEEKYRVE